MAEAANAAPPPVAEVGTIFVVLVLALGPMPALVALTPRRAVLAGGAILQSGVG